MAELKDPNEKTTNEMLAELIELQRMTMIALLEVKDYVGALAQENDEESFETIVKSHLKGFFVLPAPWATEGENDSDS